MTRTRWTGLAATLALILTLFVPAALAGPNAWTTQGANVAGVLWQLALDPTRTATVYAAGSTGSGTAFTPKVFKSTDSGNSWVDVTGAIVNVQVNVVRVDPTNGLVVYVGGYNPLAKSLALYRSDDGGATWRLLGWPFTGGDLDRPVFALAIDPTNGRNLFVGTSTNLLRSTDGGNTWTAPSGLPAAAVRSVQVDRINAAVVYVAGDAGVFKSTDGGNSWTGVSNGLPTTPVGSVSVARSHDLVIDPSDPRVLYVVAVPASGGELVFRSGDAGGSWVSASAGLPADVIRGLTIDPLSPRTLYAALNGGSGQNLMKTTDAGASWAAFSLPGGGYSSSVVVDSQNPQTLHVGHNDAVWEYSYTSGATTGTVTPAGATGTVTPTVVATPAVTGTPAPRDNRFFAETGFRVDNDAFWDYFNRRGGTRVFGFPTSRTFTFVGFTSQFFQRAIFQLGPNGQVRLVNLLDPGLLPYTSFNGAQMPGNDPAIVGAAPAPTSPSYGTAIIAFVRAQAPNTFEGKPVNFSATFDNSVTLATAYPQGGGDPGLLPGLNLELWGVPTSRPTYDPNNRNFIYQRFQRGIMHYDAGCNCTNGILLADYLKAILTGRNLPADLAEQAKASQFLRQYNPSKPGWLDRPEALSGTDLTGAFEPQ
jgi:photosystem II stability/assembly factor-like uncharacterized protein